MSRSKGSIKAGHLHPNVAAVLRRGWVMVSSDGQHLEGHVKPLTGRQERESKAALSTEGKVGFEPRLVQLVRFLQLPTPEPKPEGYAEFMAGERRQFERAASMAVRWGDVEFFRQVQTVVELGQVEVREQEMVVMADSIWRQKNKGKVPSPRELSKVIEELYDGKIIRSGRVKEHMEKLGMEMVRDRN